MAKDQKWGRRAEKAKNDLRQVGRTVARSAPLVRWVEWCIRLLLGAVLAGGSVLEGAGPFGVAFVGACGAGRGALGGLLGACLGYLLSRGLEEGLRYAATAILIFALSFAFYDVKVYAKGWFVPVASGLLTALTGVVTAAGSWTRAQAARLTGECALVVLGVYAFRCALTLWEERPQGREPTVRQRFSLVLLVLAALVSLEEPTLMGAVSVGRLLACTCTLLAGFVSGAGGGAGVGVAAGITMDLAAGSWPFYTALYACSGLIAGFLRRRGRRLTALGWLMTGAAAALWAPWGMTHLGTLWEMGLAGVLFQLLPQGAVNRAELLLAPPERGESSGTQGEAARRLGGLADAFGQLFTSLKSTFSGPGENLEDPCVLFDQAANRVCAGCPLRERCWQTGYQDTYDLLNGALPGLLGAPEARAEHFPQRFRDRCVRFPAFLSAVGEELTAYRLRRRYAARVEESRQAVCGQYGDMAQLLEEAAQAMATPLTADPRRTRKLEQFLAGRDLQCTALVFYDDLGHLCVRLEGRDADRLLSDPVRESLESVLDIPLCPGEAQGEEGVLYRQREPLMATAAAAGRNRAGQRVSGDGLRWFKDGKGTLFVMVCDGMGSGAEAREESELVLKLLEKFLRAGITPANALKTLDQALVLRGEVTGGFSTVDLLTLDLYTGQGVLYKLGAAPSYLRRGGAVSRLAGDALPAGLTAGTGGQKPDVIPFRADPGDCVVLLTDGVVEGEDGWLRAALSGFDGGSPAALAETLVTHETDCRDDKTAFVLRVGLRGE